MEIVNSFYSFYIRVIDNQKYFTTTNVQTTTFYNDDGNFIGTSTICKEEHSSADNLLNANESESFPEFKEEILPAVTTYTESFEHFCSSISTNCSKVQPRNDLVVSMLSNAQPTDTRETPDTLLENIKEPMENGAVDDGNILKCVSTILNITT